MTTGYRAFPVTLAHPSQSRRFTAAEFEAFNKTKLESAHSLCTGHKGTNIWYVESLGYIVEVLFEKHNPVYIHSICTFTPTYGMDKIDGEFAQDAEELALNEAFGYNKVRLLAYGSDSEVPIEQYLRSRGIIQ